MGDKSGLVFIGVGFELLAMVLGGLYVGEHVDKYFNLGGKGTITVVFCCLASWCIHFIYLIKKFMKDADEYEKELEKQKEQKK